MMQKQMMQNMQGDIKTLSENMSILTKRMDTLTENVGSLIEILHFMKDNLASKQDLEHAKLELRQEIRDSKDELRNEFRGEMKEMENRLMNYIDGFVGYNQKFDTELASTTSTVQRHDRYIHGVAKHVGYELN